MPVHQLVKNSPAFYKNQRFITAVHRSRPLFPILSQLIPVHTLPSYMSKMQFIIILPSTMEPSKWLLFFPPLRGFPPKSSKHFSSLTQCSLPSD